MNKVIKILPFGLIFPGLVLAQDAGDVDTSYLEGLISSLSTIIGLLIPVVIAIGLLFFIWGLVQYIAASGDESAKEEGKRKMIWGIIALFVIVAVWGFVAIIANIFGVTIGDDLTDVPGVVGGSI